MAEPDDIHRLVVEHALDLIVVLDAEDRIAYAGPSCHAVLGHPAEALAGTDPLDLVHPDDRPAGGVAPGPFAPMRLRHADTTWIHVEGHVTRLPEQGLRIVVARDVTARVRAERRRDAQYLVSRVLAVDRPLPEAAGELIRCVAEHLDWDAGVLWEGEGVTRAASWHADGLPAEDVAALARFGGLPARVWATGTPGWVTDVLADRGAGASAPGRLRAAIAVPVGSWGVLELAGRKARQDDPDRLRLFAAFGRQLDQFLERTRAEAALRESRALLGAVVGGTTNAVFVKDRDGRYLLINDAGAAAFGRPVEQVLGVDDHALLPPAAAEAVMAGDREVMERGEARTIEDVVPGPGGPRRFLATKAPYRDGTGEVAGILGIAHDITERRRLEAELRQAQKLEAIGRLAGGVAHDFNNILAVIRGFGDLARHHVAGTDQTLDAWLGHVSEATERGTALTRQLLAFSRREPLETEVLPVNAVVADMDPMLRRVLGEDLRLVTVFGATPGTVEVNRGQLEQVVLNLAVNARDAMPEGGKLQLETAEVPVDEETAGRLGLQPGPHVVLRASDTGHGMDEETRARIFDPFFTTKGGGTGLGLATVYGIVAQSGGHIGVSSAPGRGTTFTIHLPAAEALAPAPRETVAPAPLEPTAGTVLVAEDEDGLRELLRTMLEQVGYRVLVARTGEEALEVAADHAEPLDALVADVVLPGLRGPELAARLREADPHLRVVLSTGYGAQAADPGGAADAVLRKPYGMAELLEALRTGEDERLRAT